MTSRLAATAVAALLSTALLTSCDDTDGPDPDSRRGIDTRAYYEDYTSERDNDSGGTVNYSAQAESDAGDSSEPWRPPKPDEDNFFRTTAPAASSRPRPMTDRRSRSTSTPGRTASPATC